MSKSFIRFKFNLKGLIFLIFLKIYSVVSVNKKNDTTNPINIPPMPIIFGEIILIDSDDNKTIIAP
jgi:hypothetical protein